ncbi:hypothetical protein, partial [Bartonella choladocola]|uniref:hypothetical protein n=1 Tax=Bartonella choladocola TaxID=2750995 RepID=UPI001AEEC67D
IRGIALRCSRFPLVPLGITHIPSDERLKASGEAEPRAGIGKRSTYIMRILIGENPAKAMNEFCFLEVRFSAGSNANCHFAIVWGCP